MVSKNSETPLCANTNGVSNVSNHCEKTEMKSIAKVENKLTKFKFGNSAIRVVYIDDAPWFVAEDICKALKLSNPTMSMKSLDEDERSKFNLGRQGEANVVSESGMYTLVLRCRDAVNHGSVAHRFRKWVTSEVLPTIRNTGEYKASNKSGYNFPVETADPHDREFGNAWMTPSTILDEKNRAPELELLEALENDGYDITGAKIRIYAMYGIAKQLIEIQKILAETKKLTARINEHINYGTADRGMNVDFTGNNKGLAYGGYTKRRLN